MIIVVTPGEPSGIGPDLCVRLAQEPWPVRLVFMADPALLAERAQQLGLQVRIVEYVPEEPLQDVGELHIGSEAGVMEVCPVSLAAPVEAGKLDPANARYVLETLERATQGCLEKRFDALVTGPVHKGVINESGIPFSGHTEFLQEKCGVDRVVMMLATAQLRVALATTHIPLREVAEQLTAKRLEQVLTILHHDLLTSFGIADPRILVAGLNPHAGESGHMGREEIDVIEPVLSALCEKGMKLIGPLPADTLFTPKVLEKGDAVLAMYHDQGLPVLKYQGFGKAANITLGLPIIRTSVDHGTALELAGTPHADLGSLRTALDCAISMIQRREPPTGGTSHSDVGDGRE